MQLDGEGVGGGMQPPTDLAMKLNLIMGQGRSTVNHLRVKVNG